MDDIVKSLREKEKILLEWIKEAEDDNYLNSYKDIRVFRKKLYKIRKELETRTCLPPFNIVNITENEYKKIENVIV